MSHSARPLVLTAIGTVIFFLGRAPYFGQWDSFDYLKQTVTHRLSDLAVGRPVFIGYNIALWELARGAFDLPPHRVSDVAMITMVLMGGAGVLLFARLSDRMLPATAARMAALSLVLSPMYAVYSGYIMTEVPMLVAVLAAAIVLWPVSERSRLRDISGGILFGMAVGIREQALTLSGAFAWILWTRRPRGRRLRSLALFGVAAALVAVIPVLALYFHDPASFRLRMSVWLGAIPMGRVHFWRNVEASLLYLLAICPASWLALAGAAAMRRRKGGTGDAQSAADIPSPVWGFFCCLVLPIALLWRDADVQIHPRYALIALPAALILCASLYHRWIPTARAAVTWGILHVIVFGLAQVVIMPYRQMQSSKMEYARTIVESVPGEALLIAGSYSPVFDYYRGIGERPQWRILWSGWGWSGKAAEQTIREAWRDRLPVFLCDGPLAWFFFEDQRLDLLYILKRSAQVEVAPGLLRVYPSP